MATPTQKQFDVSIPEACIIEVDELVRVDENRVGVVVKWDNIEAALDRHGYGYIAKNTNIDSILCHGANRSLLMLSPTGAHSRGAFLKSVGVKVKVLEQNALAFELCPLNPERDVQLNKNRELVRVSNGLLKPVVGDERFLSVAASHVTALFRAAKHGCKTPEKELQDATGKIDVAGWSHQQPGVGTIINDGYDLKVIRWEAAVQWPCLPDLASRAKNGPGAVQVERSEIEVLANIAVLAEHAKQPIDWKQITAEATRVPCSCKDWADVLGMYARLYTDGPNAPVVYALDKAVKGKFSFRNMGEELWRQVTFTKFPGGTFKPRVLLRQAIVGAILVCNTDKVKNGLCAAFACSDISRMASKSNEPNIDMVEDMMSEARTLVGGDVECDVHVHDFDFRLIYHMASKGKCAWDCMKFDSYNAVGKQFVLECQAVKGEAFISMPTKWADAKMPDNKTEASAPSSSAGGQSSAVTMAESESPEWVLAQKGFVKDAVVAYIDPSDETRSLWTITKVADGKYSLKEHVPFGTGRKTDVVAHQLLAKFRTYSGKLQSQIDGAWATELVAGARDASSIDVMRGIIYMSLKKLEAVHAPLYQRLMVLDNPRALHAATKFNKGELILVPFVPLRLICTKGSAAGMVSLGELLSPPDVSEPTQFWISPNTTLPKPDMKDMWATPFFWVPPAQMRSALIWTS